jgi:hypothetical protein
MRQWAILGATLVGILLAAGAVWYRVDGLGGVPSRHSADEAIAALRAEGITITEVVTPPPSSEFGTATDTRRLAIATPNGQALVVVLAFARDEDRDRAAATMADPQVARVARYYARDNIALVLNPGVPDPLADRCKTALARLK